ncbi:MAG: bifunctional hydroxymethylpyrimidine kinase/phosphomethylpyrimidine kinase [Bacteroidales bacterium]|nr:bifunctional hydroxymethylpyrimidine kinase/phosphomethylpyrimidine kinase [Bacteroidales bacterium]
MKVYKRVLSIAGTDPSAGAGIQADIKTASAIGVYCTTVITGVVNQNTQGVRDILPLSPEWIEAQIRAVLDDVGTDTVKIGMLCNMEQISTIARLIREYNIDSVVLDPVLASTSGATFLKEEGLQCLLAELIPYVRLVTPNIPEGIHILGKGYSVADSMENLARALVSCCSTSVLLKGGHLKDAATKGMTMDMLCDREHNSDISTYTHEFFNTKNTHGTGCTLSTAIASYMALYRDKSLAEIVGMAHNYVANAIKYAADYEIGKGHGPLNHFWNTSINQDNI